MAISATREMYRTEGRFSGNNARFYAFAAFLTLVFFTGGSSRDDVQSLLVLRPLAVLFGAYAIICMDRETWKGRTFPLYVTLALGGLMVLQLVPLPPAAWTLLPGREFIVEIADLAGIEQTWRPMTLSPSRTLNSLFSLSVPIAGMMLYLNLDVSHRKQAITVIIVLSGISALWAIVQLTGSARNPFYLYNITNPSAAVGLFANRNHQAVLLAAMIAILGWYGASHSIKAKFASLKFYGSIVGIFVIIPLIFITGSRSGLILMTPALMAAIFLMYRGRYVIESQPSANRNRPKQRAFASQQIVLFVSIALVLAMAALSVYLSRSLAFDRLFDSNFVDELRGQLLPILTTMMGDYFPWGSGFGSFEHVYRIYEPQELLNPSYLNQAHNDWLQFPIEGGVPAVTIAAVALIWAAKEIFILQRNWQFSQHKKYAAVMAIVTMLIFLADSIGDYPLRVPSLITIFAIMACVLRDHIRNISGSAVKI